MGKNKKHKNNNNSNNKNNTKIEKQVVNNKQVESSQADVDAIMKKYENTKI